jgi:Fic-DOC domain mobile mystery protein B
MGLTSEYIAGQTVLDEEERAGLRIRSISTKAELNEFEQMNIEKAVEWTLTKTLSYDHIFTEEFVRMLHHKMFSDVWEWAGQFRKSNKNIGVGMHQVATSLRQLLDDALFWTKHKTYPADEIAIRFKHRLVSIHCFANGNGRHSRLMADVIRSSVFDTGVFSWGRKAKAQNSDPRKNYLEALRKADKNNIRPLLEFAKS